MKLNDISLQECYNPFLSNNQLYDAFCECVDCENCEGTGGVFPEYLRNTSVCHLRLENKPCHMCGGTGLVWQELRFGLSDILEEEMQRRKN